MPNLTQMELNTLKELVLMEDVNAKKFQLYAQNCTDNQLRNTFTQEAQQAFNNSKTLLNFLSQQ